ncbi:glutathione S-transferase [Povalibacter uvarum]|uniref:Glutathione S-transferase n=2 Tax=Povalibacter uvarum TaxID=732238 RepID=A0A841HUM9_9GAMM|nr:glutathione S-transferase family protein [Povalibacter uvarum]MBB6096523.1 glutathione S-transferase [Povalibacter uvarum]
MRLYEFGPTRSLRVRWTLQELGVPFQSVIVDMSRNEHQLPDFLSLNPAAKLPVLVDGDLVLNESAAIVLYLAEKYADKGLVPKDLRERADMTRWLLFTVTELEQPLWRIARNTFVYAESDRVAADVPVARRDFEAMAAVMDAHMRDREFVVGNHVTVADFVLAYTLDWANEEELLAKFPRLKAYMEKLYRRPTATPRIAAAMAAVQAAG